MTDTTKPLTLVTAPFTVDVMTLQFTEPDTELAVDYTNSRLKGQALLVYLGNVNLKCHLSLSSFEEVFEMVKAYLHSPSLVSLPELEDLTAQFLLAARGLPCQLNFDVRPFLKENEWIVNVWLKRLGSLNVYAVACMQDETGKEWAQQFPEVEFELPQGINFVNLIKNDAFILLVTPRTEEDKKDWAYCKTLFNDYIFKGKNLFHFWAVEENPMYVASVVTLESKVDFAKLHSLLQQDEAALKALQNPNKDPNVPPL